MKIIYVYRTHFWNSFCKTQYKNIQSDCGKENVFLLYDNTKNSFPDVLDQHIIQINNKDCEKINTLHKNNKEQVESQICVFTQNCPVDFDHLWLIEYDVVCDGNWHSTFEKCNSNSSDFLGTCVQSYAENMFWGLWYRIYGRIRHKPAIQKRYKCFFPITRFSKSLITELQKNMGIYSGFCEVYIPTLAKQKNLTIENIPQDMLGETFIYSESKDFKAVFKNENKLYHPFVSFDNITHQ
jgi:hypothetical protein